MNKYECLITDFIEDIEEFKNLNTNFTLFTKNNFIFNKYSNSKNIKCIHLESLVNENKFNEYTEFTYQFVNEIVNNLINQKILSSKLANLFSRTLGNSILCLIHNYFIIENLVQNNNYKLNVYDTNHPKEVNSLNIEFDRYENLYSLLAKEVFIGRINLIKLNKIILPKNKKLNLTYFYYKFLNLLFLDKNSLIGKLISKSIIKKQSTNELFFYGENDAFPYINYKFNKKIKNLKKINYKFDIPKNLDNHLNTKFRKQVLNKFFNFKLAFQEEFFNLYLDRLNLAINIYKFNQKKLDNFFENYINSNMLKGKILTNGFFRETEKIFYFKLIEKNIKIIAFEHGMTLGLSDFSNFYKSYYSLAYSDIKILRSELSKNIKTINTNHPSREYVLGTPSVYRKNFYTNFFNNFFAKFLLGLNPFNKYISLSIPADKNNFVYGPLRFREFDNYKYTQIIIEYLLSKFPKHKLILKLYPADRYIDSGVFKDIYHKNKRIVIRMYPDYKFYLKICEYNFTTVFTSTMEIMKKMSSNSFYISFNQNKLTDNFESEGENIYFKGNNFKLISLDKLDFLNDWNIKILNKIL